MTALGTSLVGPRSVKPLPNALCRVSRTVLCTNRRHLARGDPPQTQPDPVSVFLEGTKLVPISLLQSMSRSRGRVCGDILSKVPEASLTSYGELSLGTPYLWAP